MDREILMQKIDAVNEGLESAHMGIALAAVIDLLCYHIRTTTMHDNDVEAALGQVAVNAGERLRAGRAQAARAANGA